MHDFSNRGLIETAELAQLLESGTKVKIVDATYIMPGSPIDGRDLYEQRRIDGAVYFDIDRIADPDSALPHMLPSETAFEKAAGELGIGNDDLVVIYDQSGIAMAAARVWWTFRVFGHDNVCILNGGLPYWEATGGRLTSGPAAPPAPAIFKARFRPELVRDLDAVRKASKTGNSLIVDARSAERFSGSIPEPRAGLRAGHIPQSHNLPFMSLIDPRDGRLKDSGTLKEIMAGLLDVETTEIVASCGSGVTACVTALAYFRLGKQDVAVYDGSWTEWGDENAGTDIAVGA